MLLDRFQQNPAAVAWRLSSAFPVLDVAPKAQRLLGMHCFG
jgi:hypothetical protein